MAFVTMGGCEIIKLKEFDAEDVVIEGTYVGSFETKFGNPGFKFREKNGKTRAVACGSLTYKMDGVKEGSLCRVVYLGEQEVKKGTYAGKTFHDVELFVDDPSIPNIGGDDTEGIEF